MTISFTRNAFFQNLFHLSDDELKDDQHVADLLTAYFTLMNFEAKVKIDGDEVSVTLDTTAQWKAEADREIEKIANFAAKGNYTKAMKGIDRALERHPHASELHRMKGQILSDQGDSEGAVNALIDALRFDPENKWALIMMGNIFARDQNDIETGKTYYEKALEVDPKDNIAMSNIGAVLMERRQFVEGEKYLLRALELNDKYINTYLGLALAGQQQGQFDIAFDWAIKGLKNAGDKGRVGQMVLGIAIESAEQLVQANDGIRTVEGYMAKLEVASGKPIKVEKSNEIPFAAKLEIAENKDRDYHLVRYKPNYTAVAHLVLHELVHLQFVDDARKASRNELYVTRPAHAVKFRSRLGKYITKLNKAGYPMASVDGVIDQLFSGLNAQVYNTPIDLFIEQYIFDNFSRLRPHQFLSLLRLTQDGIKAVTSKEIVALSDPWILDRSKSYNLINAMGLRDIYGVDLIGRHDPAPTQLKKAEKLFKEYLEYKNNKGPGEEYDLVNNWADDLGLLGYFELLDENEYRSQQVDPITLPPSGMEGYESSESESFREKEMSTFLEKHQDADINMAVVMFMVGALKSLMPMPQAKIKDIAFQIAQIGMSGISPEQDGYHVPLLPGSDFSGYQMLAHYYVSWALAIPEMVGQLQLPFQQEYAMAQQLLRKFS
ncbi:tetratricopeptide repeat protein [Neolewinella lacunae]|uniref:Tetratricopeptide repeat protein n=1 Tax=Neolewinella lacunae TaxID=1517758 RepID=A0A923T616_9BACT|nr:tetratricopeptide repeat protein [Neolewinella lacunae]MBC6992935.1 tetratricopeptide repeat protein [Neolewinella lacunae]MDN3633701.1 tetratricopeptide repeat protein [Neolewinella lacunae]